MDLERWKQRKQGKRGVYVSPVTKPFTFKNQKDRVKTLLTTTPYHHSHFSFGFGQMKDNASVPTCFYVTGLEQQATSSICTTDHAARGTDRGQRKCGSTFSDEVFLLGSRQAFLSDLKYYLTCGTVKVSLHSICLIDIV